MNKPMLVFTGALLLGVLGCGDDARSPTEPGATAPRAELAVTSALSFYQLSAGLYHTCGVTTDAHAYCWGWGFYGQLGTGTEPYRDSVPAAVGGGLSFRNVSAGDLHSCGVTTSYRAYCWGNNGYAEEGKGALGDGTTTTRYTPVAVAGGRSFRQVTAGDMYTCGITTSDVAFCWGYNAYGQLGDGSTTDRLTPVRVAGGLLWKQLSVGEGFTCGITLANKAYCWGYGAIGQLGDGAAITRLRPHLVAGGYLFTQIDVGGAHACAVTTTHRAFCWGSNQFGQLGDGTQINRVVPRAVAGGLAFGRVSAGGSHTCGEVSQQAYCWGKNKLGQDGSGGAGLPRLKPTVVKGGLFFGQVTAGYQHTCGKTTASVAYCWGAGEYGQLGDGTTAYYRGVPTPVASP